MVVELGHDRLQEIRTDGRGAGDEGNGRTYSHVSDGVMTKPHRRRCLPISLSLIICTHNMQPARVRFTSVCRTSVSVVMSEMCQYWP